MELFGDIERFVATNLYPLRVPIAIGLLVTAVVVLWVAWRRHWVDTLRRHPRATIAGVVIALVLGGPLAWYLGSPLFIRTELVEQAAVGDQGDVVRSGAFEGADEFHFAEGRATIVEVAPGRHTLRFADFSVRNGPDLYVYLVPTLDGSVDGGLEVGLLKASDGAFEYELPPDTDPGAYAGAVVWCRQFAVLFGTAAFG